MNAKVSIVGAGPGDPELITIKALRYIQDADAILYDALINKELLTNAKPSCELKYVGKRAGNASHSQDEINHLIVEYAQTHGHVVRLKGGDPYVFGRGFEELTFVQAHQIPVEYIPGLSSATAVPGIAGIPITFRGQTQSFHVHTATQRKGQINPDLIESLDLAGSHVILMGLRQLEKIVAALDSKSKKERNIAVIQRGSWHDQKVVTGSPGNIVDRVRTASIQSPAIIVISDSQLQNVKPNV